MPDPPPQFELKAISTQGIAKAQAKAERYRLLNEPRDAESICRDILRADPDNQPALITMMLAMTDQFGKGQRVNVGHAKEVVPRIQDEYARMYYTGVICERWAKSHLNDEKTPGYVVYDWFVRAMHSYEQADALSPDTDEDAKLRWNACARMIRRNEQVRPRPEDHLTDEFLQDDVPIR